MFDGSAVATHLDSTREHLRAERAAIADKLISAGTFALARMAELGHSHQDWIVDDWELAAAELGADLGISRGRACTQMTHGRALIQRLPGFAEVFRTGAVDFQVFLVIFQRTALIVDPDILAVIDSQVAEAAPHWNALSRDRVAELVDWMVIEVDPEAVRRARESRRTRSITVEPIGDGMVEIYGRVDAAKGATFDHGLDALARTVCPDDPRSFQERRADAVEPLTLGAKSIPCLCGREDCPSAGNEVAGGHIVIHVLAEQPTLTGESERPALLPGYGAVHADQVQQMLPNAVVRPVPEAGALGTEPGYHPSKKLGDFVRCRDLTCRWPGCRTPIERCDIDHTVPWPYGVTHPSNTKLFCRIHHLIKTFCTGWSDSQEPDGTITFTTPNGRTYTTKPGGALFFPQLSRPTEALTHPPTPPPHPLRGLAVPTRRRTRAHNQAYRIAHERARNRADIEADPPPF
ncbi:HNH endonuclease signature motif containing protein [Mycolicibacterium sp. P9-22]|uniref:HNH endonuclease signature motif containing protein n=1 Tax=Mycolicibacterium sp. P9-22 TaxID=2024613 RepID=UPI0011EF261F|nr:HNH endonuclease signature motif containing protein [Mycolicibacterium sp. P9-22]KAA0109414.1 HNH endonuclease [Mycolicibacterium sp. P9-22]